VCFSERGYVTVLSVAGTREAVLKSMNEEATTVQRLQRASLTCLTVAVVCAHAYYLWKVRTGVPHQDEWQGLDDMFAAIDGHRIAAWLFQPHNGHVGIPSCLATLFAYKFLALDLTGIRFLAFPVCFATFAATAHLIRRDAENALLRQYVFFSASCISFNLCYWEHFTQAAAFTSILALLFAAVAVYYVARAGPLTRFDHRSFVLAMVWLAASLLSFGLGYLAAIACVGLFTFTTCRESAFWKANRVVIVGSVTWLAATVVLLVIASYPNALFGSHLVHLFRFTLVLGSIGASSFDGGDTAQAIGYFSGAVLLVLALWVLVRSANDRENRTVLAFAVGLVMLGLLCSAAVVAVRATHPTGEFLSSRYTLYPAACLLGVLLYAAANNRVLLPHVWTITVMWYLLASVKEQEVGRYRPAVYKAIENAMRNIDAYSDAQLGAIMYWKENPKAIRRVVAKMRAEHLNIFRDGG
jgi:hypothetical protein